MQQNLGTLDMAQKLIASRHPYARLRSTREYRQLQMYGIAKVHHAEMWLKVVNG